MQREMKSVNNIFGDFLVKSGLYDEIEITEDSIFELADLIGGHVKIESYCPKCKESRVFSCEMLSYFWYDESGGKIEEQPLEDEIVFYQRIQNTSQPNSANTSKVPWTWTNESIKNNTRLMVFKFFCAMDNTHHLDYIVLTNENKMKKIGQYPSVADLSLPELKEYRKVMTKEDEREFKRAIGLYASGMGIGSFVYLRRIFERIILTASEKAIKDGKIEKEQFEKARVKERIKMLADYLPTTLVDRPEFYGIVSKGIHELSEDDCIEFFPIMQKFIIMILRQLEKARKDKEDEKNLANAFNKIVSKIQL